METAQPLLAIFPTLDCSTLKRFSLESSQKPLCFSLWLLSLVLPPCSIVESDFIFSVTSLEVLAGSYQVPMKSGIMSHAKQASVHMASAPAPSHLGGPSLNSLWFTNAFLMPRLGEHHWSGTADAIQVNTHLPWPTGLAPINRCICNPTFLFQILPTCYIPIQDCFLTFNPPRSHHFAYCSRKPEHYCQRSMHLLHWQGRNCLLLQVLYAYIS